MAAVMGQVVDGWAKVCEYADDFAQPAVLHETVESLSATSGVSAEELRFFLVLISAYPIGLTWRALPTATMKHLFSVVLGIWILQFVVGYQWLHVVIPSLVSWFAMRIAGPRARWFVSLFALGYLAGGHIYRMVTDYLGWTMDWTMMMMIVIQKLGGVSFNYYDGAAAKAPSASQKNYAIPDCPSLLEFMGFILFPSGIAIGPAFEFADFRRFARGELTSPAPYAPGLWRLFQSLAMFAFHMAVMSTYPTYTLLNDKEFLANGILSRLPILWISLLGYRFKYYFGWKIAEGACIMSGLGYNGVDKESGKHLWNRVEAVDVLKYETAQSLREASMQWNKTTNLWLRRYWYDRFPSSVNLYVTYLVSAFWHGFYAGYYMFFMTVAFATTVHRSIRRTIRPRFMMEDGKTPGPYKPLYDVASLIATNVTVNYFIISFVVLSFSASIAAFRSFYFVGQIIVVGLYLVFASGLIRPPKQVKKE